MVALADELLNDRLLREAIGAKARQLYDTRFELRHTIDALLSVTIDQRSHENA
jgi:hypothetical protein